MNQKTESLVACQSDAACKEACRVRPLIKLDVKVDRRYTVRELLLSTIAIGPNVPSNIVINAIDQLINLQCPIINRILEVSAFYRAFGGLSIYCANSNEFSKLKTQHENFGYFSAADNLILVSSGIDIAQSIIHELTHAVHHFVTTSHDEKVTTYLNFIKFIFPKLFREAKTKPNEPLMHEKAELALIEERKRTFLNEYRLSSPQVQFANLDRLTAASQVFQAQISNVTALRLQRVRFFDRFAPYHESDQSKEFLPFFLEEFVRATSNNSHDASILQLFIKKNKNNPTYHAELYDTLWKSIPKQIIENFVSNGFRTIIEHKAALCYGSVQKLTDSELYEFSQAEPRRYKKLPEPDEAPESLDNVFSVKP